MINDVIHRFVIFMKMAFQPVPYWHGRRVFSFDNLADHPNLNPLSFEPIFIVAERSYPCPVFNLKNPLKMACVIFKPTFRTL